MSDLVERLAENCKVIYDGGFAYFKCDDVEKSLSFLESDVRSKQEKRKDEESLMHDDLFRLPFISRGHKVHIIKELLDRGWSKDIIKPRDTIFEQGIDRNG